MKNKKGFTLIELLAIIVILAIIAVITVPIILNIIENSKKGAIQDSALGYKEAIKSFYLSKLYENKEYTIPDKSYTTTQLKRMGVSVNGKEPEGNSWMRIEHNNTVNGCLQYDEYKVDIANGEVGNTQKGECEKPGPTYIAPTATDTHSGIVYLNPTNIDNTCNEKKEEQNRTNNSIVNVKTGCMKWYIFSESNFDINEDGIISEDEEFYNLILDHNTSMEIEWTKQKENNNYINYNGPQEALYQLYEDTKDWAGIEDLTVNSNYTASWTKNTNHTYTIDYTKHLERSQNGNTYTYTLVNGAHKARFITAEEIATICNTSNWTISSNYFFLDNGENGRTEINPSNYAWLYENLSECKAFGCKKQSENYYGNHGYWTGSPVGNSNNQAWIIEYGGRNYASDIERLTNGIRPVITIQKSIIET